jgi:hypothetical protein
MKSIDEKIKLVEKHYEIIDSDDIQWVKCYKAVNVNYSSIYAKNIYTYDDMSKTYETNCDYNMKYKNSSGFGCWTLENAIQFGKESNINDYRIITVMCPLEHMCMLENGKIRAGKMKIISLS